VLSVVEAVKESREVDMVIVAAAGVSTIDLRRLALALAVPVLIMVGSEGAVCWDGRSRALPSLGAFGDQRAVARHRIGAGGLTDVWIKEGALDIGYRLLAEYVSDPEVLSAYLLPWEIGEAVSSRSQYWSTSQWVGTVACSGCHVSEFKSWL